MLIGSEVALVTEFSPPRVPSARMPRHLGKSPWPLSFAAWISALAFAPSAVAQGTAAQFQGVERWQGTYTWEINITLAGTRKHKSGETKFTLDKHRVEGSTEIWEGKIKSKDSDEDQTGVFSGTLVGGKTADLKLILEMNGDVAKLASHSDPSKHKMKMKVMGQTIQSMNFEQPAQDGSAEVPIAEDAENLVFTKESDGGRGIYSKSVMTLTPNEIPLRAVLTAGSAGRGSKATLDASRSKGRIKTLHWTLKPSGASGAPAVTFETTERKVELVLLEDVQVELEVRDGKRKSSTSGTAKVIPRQWKTTFIQEPNDGILEAQKLVSPERVPAENHFGQDACAFEGEDSGDGLHATRPGKWKDDASAGYLVSAIDDPGRPFDGYWYVTKQSLIVRRRALFNPDLVKGSVLFEVNRKNKTSEAFARLVAASHDHEYMHGELMRRELLRDDPAKRIERLVKRSEDELATFAEMEVRATETRLQEGAFHEQDVRNAMKKKYAKGGTVYVRDGSGDFAPWTIASFADKGH
jgi:hypothetical protein